MNRGLRIKVLKIVVHSPAAAKSAKQKFLEIQQEGQPRPTDVRYRLILPEEKYTRQKPYEVFISYSHEDLSAAQLIAKTLQQSIPESLIFFDRRSIVPGNSWLMNIANSLDTAKRVAALFTPQYWSSSYCKDEFTAALTRQYDIGKPILFPIYFQSAEIPYLFRNLQYADCREANLPSLQMACATLLKEMSIQ